MGDTYPNAFVRSGVRQVELGRVSKTATQDDTVSLNPFATLTRVAPEDPGAASTILIVMPMSGIIAALVRDLVITLKVSATVYVLDWTDARSVPVAFGPFGYDDQIETIAAACRYATQPLHLLGLCQSVAPSLIAAEWLLEHPSGQHLKSLTLVGGPVDPSANPTQLANSILATPMAWLELFAIERVGWRHTGAGRQVYPGSTQLNRVRAYIEHEVASGGPLERKVLKDDGLNAELFPFLETVQQLKDIPADAFLENIRRIYHGSDNRNGRLVFQDRLLDGGGLTGLPILTIEGDADNVVAPGQTAAALALFPGQPGIARETLVIPNAGHFDLFHGEISRSVVGPAVLDFIRQHA
ncbi:MAG: hypothetical protein AAF709_22985 [Pseudomonadota bacterium]